VVGDTGTYICQFFIHFPKMARCFIAFNRLLCASNPLLHFTSLFSWFLKTICLLFSIFIGNPVPALAIVLVFAKFVLSFIFKQKINAWLFRGFSLFD
jgi:hypothetical protein